MQRVLAAAATGLAATVLLGSCELSVLLAEWRRAEIGWWAVALLLFGLQTLTGAAAFSLLATGRLTPGGFARLLEVGWVQAAARITPARVGELVLIRTVRDRASAAAVATAIGVARLVSLAVWGTLFLLFAPAALLGVAAFRMIAGLLIAVALLALLLMRWRPGVLGKLRLPPPVRAGLAALRAVWDRARPSTTLLAVTLLACGLGLQVLLGAIVLWSLQATPPLAAWTGIAAAAAVAQMTPLFVWGLGAAETVMALGLAPYGIGAECALTAAVLGRVLFVLVALLWGAAYALVNVRRRPLSAASPPLAISEPTGNR